MENYAVGLLLMAICLLGVSGNKRLVLHSDQDILVKVKALESQFLQLENRLQQVEQENKILKNINGGSTYIRWGQTSCPVNGTRLVYRGYAGGSHSHQYGGGVNTLCMPEDPTWNKYSVNEQWVGYIYGTEIDSSDSQSVLGQNVWNQDISCALCHTDRLSTVMIPGRTNCYPGWTQEYTGYLFGGYPNHKSNTDFICLDENPRPVPHGGNDDDDRVLYFVESSCTSLSCPPYVNGRELACVVCSK